MSTLEGTTMHPRCRHIGACWDLLEWFHLFGTSQNISQNSISNLKRKKVKQNTSRNSISNFFEKIRFLFPCCSTRENLSIDVSITIIGLMLTKLGWFQLLGTSQNSISNFFEKNIKILGFPCCSTREDLSIDVSITIVGLILTKLWWFLFSGYGQMDRQTDGRTDRRTDTVLESSYGNTSAHEKFQLKTQKN